MSIDDEIKEHRKALKLFAEPKEGLEHWTIKNSRIYHIPCKTLIGFGMILRQIEWNDGYCVSCGAAIPAEMMRKLHFIYNMEAI